MMRTLIEKLQSERQDLLKVIGWYRQREHGERGRARDVSSALTSHMLRLGDLEAELIELRAEQTAKRRALFMNMAQAVS